MNAKIAAANWKMYKTPTEALAFFKEFSSLTEKGLSCETVFFAPSLCLGSLVENNTSLRFNLGAQNCHFEKEGAFTGENSPATLAQMGLRNVLIGHSERRSLFGETDELIAKKVVAAQSFGLVPMLCIGETLSEREAGKTNSVLERQLSMALKAAERGKKIVVAYEPVWAIGTGKVAEPQQVREAHEFVHAWLAKNFVDLSVLYGGSVKADNAKTLAAVPGVDGFLVGGASLKPATFLEIASAL